MTEINVPGGAGSDTVTLVASTTVAGSAADTIDVTGLDSDTHGAYYIVISIDNSTGSTSVITAELDGDTTATNYFDERTNAAGSGITAANGNSGRIGTVDPNEGAIIQGILINDITDIPRGMFYCTYDKGTGTNWESYGWHHNVTNANITSFLIRGSQANTFDVGSYVKVYKRIDA